MAKIIGYALGEPTIPVDFVWPSADEYTKYTAQALERVKQQGYSLISVPSELAQVVDAARPILTATAGGMHSVLSVAIETAVGKGLTAIAGGSIGSLAPKFVNCVTDLFNGEVSAGVSGAISLVGDVSSVLSGFPAIGQAAGFVAGVVGQIIDEANAIASLRDRASAACKERLAEACRDALSVSQYEPSGSEGVTPSDMFRACLYTYRAKRATSPATRWHPDVPGEWLPFAPSSLYVLLCGGETQGMGFDRARYDSIMQGVRASYGPKLGIARETQRTMWTLIKGIMFASQPPGYVLRSDIASIGDKGRSLFPVLQDMVRNEWLRGTWNEAMLATLARNFLWTVGAWGAAQSGTQAANVWCDCSEGVVDLVTPFMRGLGGWQAQLEEKFLRNGRYVFAGTGKLKSIPKGTLVMSASQARKLVDAASPRSGMSVFSSLTHLSGPKVAALTVGTAAAAYLGYEGYKALSKRARR